MFTKAIVGSMLLAFALSSEILEFDNNFIEYGDYPPAQSISLPYPYQGSRNKQVIVESAAPVYSDTYANIIAPATEVVPSGFISTAISCTFDAVKAILAFLLTNVPALIAGTAIALGICKLTSLCDSQVTIYDAQTELRSLATPERLSTAVNFLKEAVRKYNEMQKK